MDIITILQALLRWGIPALAGGIVVFLLLASAYLIYKKSVSRKKDNYQNAGNLCCSFVLLAASGVWSYFAKPWWKLYRRVQY